MRIAEIRDRAPLCLEPIAARIGRDGLPQMVFNFLLHASRRKHPPKAAGYPA
jgi:hypothetical protein